MNNSSQFRAVDGWRTALGLLPVHLRETPENGERYILLNGASGNFCLDFVGGVDRSHQRDAAWSCDVGHYVTCVNESIIVNRWDRQAPEENYSWRSVLARLHEFHRHLEKTSPDRSRSVVAHVLRIFRQIRAAVEEQNHGLRSLRILLHLLASTAAKQDRIVDSETLKIWGLTPDIADCSQSLSAVTWHSLYNDLSGIETYDSRRPDFQLILRHASGAIFQDAHLEAQGSPTLWLPGLEQPVTVASRTIPSEIGIYFTPSPLARTLAEEATRGIQDASSKPLTLFDPACGSGELLKECLRLLKIKKHAGAIRAVGWDKSPVSVDMARFVLTYEKKAWPDHQVEIDVSLRDSLSADKFEGADILIMNPPFKSWQLMEQAEKEAVTKLLGSSNRPNLALVFARMAVDALHAGGTLAMITPNSLFEADSGESVREALAKALDPQLIARLGDQNIFARALVDTGIYVGKRKAGQEQPTAVLWADSEPESFTRALRGLRTWRRQQVAPIDGEGFSIYTRKDVGTTGAPWIARGLRAWSSYETLRSNKRMIAAADVFDISQGVRLGNDVFIVAKGYVEELGKRERRFFRPAVMNPSISNALLNDEYYVFYRYTEGLPDITTEQELRDYVPTYFKTLSPLKAKLASRKHLKEANQKWWDLLRPREWQKGRNNKLVSKYFGGEHSFAFDNTGDFVVVVGNAWLLKAGAIDLDITDKEIYLAFLAYLNSAIAESLIQYRSVQVSGGQWDLSKKYLAELLIPNLAKLDRPGLDALIQMGTRISERKIERWDELNDMVVAIIN